MPTKTIRATLIAATVAMLAGPAFADHNSVWGAGWANMPNDIHNTRIDTRLEDDNDAFIDFVRAGAGADSVNRYLTDSTVSVRGVGVGGAGSQGGSRR